MMSKIQSVFTEISVQRFENIAGKSKYIDIGVLHIAGMA
jgi:hypothetical protein